jgi:hypothetical protein
MTECLPKTDVFDGKKSPLICSVNTRAVIDCCDPGPVIQYPMGVVDLTSCYEVLWEFDFPVYLWVVLDCAENSIATSL